MGLTAWAAILLVPDIGAAAPDDNVVVPEPGENQPQGEIAEANFDQWVFQGAGNAEAGKQRIANWLTMRLDEIDRECGLSDEQKEKLRLAGRGDVRRFEDEVEVVRQKFLKLRKDPNAMGQIWQDIQPLQAKMHAGLFGERSIFGKTLRSTLSPEQIVTYDEVRQERSTFRYRACIEVSLQTLENAVPLLSEQHDSLVKLLLDETSPPDVFGQHDNQYVLYRLATLPRTKIKELVDERQMKLLERQLNGYRNMKQFLIQQGAIAKDGR